MKRSSWKTAMSACAAALFIFAGSVHALNKCTDTNGRITYSDQPCAASSQSASLGISHSPAHNDSNAGSSPPRNMKTLYACERGKKDACYEKEMLDKRCLLQRKEGSGEPLSDCRAYEADRAKFREWLHACRTKNHAQACLPLDCVEGRQGACEQWQQAQQANRQSHDEFLARARSQGLPSGKGWAMTQAWRAAGDGSQSAIITCQSGTSVALHRKPPQTHHILTGVTGNAYFTTVEDAAMKACTGR